MFVDSLVAGDVEAASVHAKNFGQPDFKNWRHIATALGLHMTREIVRKKVAGKNQRTYTIVLKAFFSDQVAFEIKNINCK
jgi:hypothetical protein